MHKKRHHSKEHHKKEKHKAEGKKVSEPAKKMKAEAPHHAKRSKKASHEEY
jgi:hypothetical protein